MTRESGCLHHSNPAPFVQAGSADYKPLRDRGQIAASIVVSDSLHAVRLDSHAARLASERLGGTIAFTLPFTRATTMADLTRVSISLEASLLDLFDKLIEAKGYATRSEAIRDLIRDRLIREEAKNQAAEQVAVVTIVFDHHARELAAKLIEKQHHHHNLVVSSLHVHLGERHCLEVSVLRGPGHEVVHLGDELLATKGVLHGDITFTSGEASLNRLR
jgi:CopG family nickel-responsive transcriptional regulator